MTGPTGNGEPAAGFTPLALEHFAEHAIDPAEAAGVGVTERGRTLIYPCVDEKGPFERRRKLTGNPEKKTTQPKGRALVCWWPRGRPEHAAYVLACEGESDALAALSAIARASSLPDAPRELLQGLSVVALPGASFPVKRLVDELRQLGAEHAVLAADADDAGDKCAEKAALALAAAKIETSRLSLPKGTDLADCLAAADDPAEWLAGAIADAEALAQEASPSTSPSPGDTVSERAPTPAERLVALARRGEPEFFHTPEREAWATVPTGGHRETMRIDSPAFELWLGQHAHESGVVKQEPIKDAIRKLRGEAIYRGAVHEVFTRVAEKDGAIYLDLGDERWRAVEIRPNGWTILEAEPPVKFRRGRGMGALPEPIRGGSIEALRRFVNVPDEHNWRLFVGFLVGCLNPVGPYPILPVHGEHGSAKSMTARVARRLIDPAKPEMRTARTCERDERNLWIAAQDTWILAFDNLSTLSAAFSDALCRVTSGGGSAERVLYANDEEVVFEAARPVIVTSIEPVVKRPDLLSRSMPIETPVIARDVRRPEKALLAEFDEEHPLILGALLDVVACALANREKVNLPDLPRLADHAEWVAAAESALGWDPGTYVAAHAISSHETTEAALEASPLWPHLEKLADGKQRTATELLRELAQLAGEAATRQRNWPGSSSALSGMLTRLRPDLRREGIEFERGHTGSGAKRPRGITLHHQRENAVPAVPAAPPALQSQIPRDGRDAAAENGTAVDAPTWDGGDGEGRPVDDVNTPAFPGSGTAGTAGTASLLGLEKKGVETPPPGGAAAAAGDGRDVEPVHERPADCPRDEHAAHWRPHPATGRIVCWLCHPPAGTSPSDAGADAANPDGQARADRDLPESGGAR